MSNLLDTLCNALDEELERQENVLALCTAQQTALIERNVAYLREVARSLDNLIREAREAEKQRGTVVAQVARNYHIPAAQPTLSDLVAAAPEPWKSRLGYFQRRLREVLSETRRVVRDNDLRARRSLHIVQDCIAATWPRGPLDQSRYNSRGTTRMASRCEPALIDARG